MRNSVKVVIEAYNGTMRFYVFDQADPMIRTYERMFPGMFLPRSAMPSALQAHVRYPMDYFTTQAEVFATYHVTDPTLLYNKGNQWQNPHRCLGVRRRSDEPLLHDHAPAWPDT